jgi:hypothetical protein
MLIDRVTITDNGSDITVVGQDAIVRNSVIHQVTGTYAVGVTGSITGSTVTSAAGSAIVNSDNDHQPGDYCELDVTNTIAVGDVRNMRTVDGLSGCDPVIRVNYSWVPSAGTGGGISDPGGFITWGGNNLANTPPAIANPLSGGTSLALDSPAINAGCGGSCGNEDLYGRPRPIGAGNDIGATETILPPAVSGVGVIVTGPSSASLSATVNPNGAVTAHEFQVRRTGASAWTSYSRASTDDSTADVAASGTATGLTPDTSYEVRAVGTNSAGEVASTSTATFRTAVGPTPAPAHSVSLVSARARTTTRAVTITSVVRTSGAGRVTQRATTGTARLTTWCRATRPVTAAGTHTVTCRLGTRGRAAIRRRALALTLRTTFTPTGASATGVDRRITVRRSR